MLGVSTPWVRPSDRPEEVAVRRRRQVLAALFGFGSLVTEETLAVGLPVGTEHVGREVVDVFGELTPGQIDLAHLAMCGPTSIEVSYIEAGLRLVAFHPIGLALLEALAERIGEDGLVVRPGVTRFSWCLETDLASVRLAFDEPVDWIESLECEYGARVVYAPHMSAVVTADLVVS